MKEGEFTRKVKKMCFSHSSNGLGIRVSGTIPSLEFPILWHRHFPRGKLLVSHGLSPLWRKAGRSGEGFCLSAHQGSSSSMLTRTILGKEMLSQKL